MVALSAVPARLRSPLTARLPDREVAGHRDAAGIVAGEIDGQSVLGIVHQRSPMRAGATPASPRRIEHEVRSGGFQHAALEDQPVAALLIELDVGRHRIPPSPKATG